MGYGVVLVMKKSFDGSKSFEGRVAYAREFEQLTKDLVVETGGVQYYEDFFEETDEVRLRTRDRFEVCISQNLIRIWTSLKWYTFFEWESQGFSQRKEFQRMIDLIQPEECWIGTDYATDQICDVEAGFDEWLEDVQKEYGPIGEFDFDGLYENLKRDIWPKDLYYVKNNSLY